VTISSLPVAGVAGDVHIPVPRRPGVGTVVTTSQPPRSGPEGAGQATTGIPDNRAWRVAAWLVPAIVTLAVTGIGVAGPGLWADELATWGMTTISWSETWRQLGGTDATLGAYYVGMHLWCMVFGDSDVALRLPSMLAMAGSAAVLGRIGTRLLSARGGLIAGLVFALLPVTTRYGQEARPYAMAVFFAALATLLLVRMLDRLTFAIGIGYAVSVTALCYMHLIAGLLILAHGVALCVLRPKLLWRWIPTVALGLTPVLPVILLGQSQNGQISWIELAGLNTVQNYAESFFGSSLVGGAVLLLGFAGLGRERVSAVAGSVALAPAVALLAAGTMMPLWQKRYLVFTLVGWALLAAAALERRSTTVALTVVTCLAAISIPGHRQIRTPGERLQDTKAVAAVINRDFRPGDGIVYGLTDRGPGALNRDIVIHYLPVERRPKDLLIQRPMRTDGYMVASECADVAACLGKTPRVWVLRLGVYTDPIAELDGKKTEILRRGYTTAGAWHMTGLTVALLQRNGG
jgi:mannosyltransferase